jgi:hypothetical protein
MIIVKTDEVAVAQAIAKLLDQIGSERLIQLTELIQEGYDLNYAVVKIVIVDRRIDGFRLEKLIK